MLRNLIYLLSLIYLQYPPIHYYLSPISLLSLLYLLYLSYLQSPLNSNVFHFPFQLKFIIYPFFSLLYSQFTYSAISFISAVSHINLNVYALLFYLLCMALRIQRYDCDITRGFLWYDYYCEATERWLWNVCFENCSFDYYITKCKFWIWLGNYCEVIVRCLRDDWDMIDKSKWDDWWRLDIA